MRSPPHPSPLHPSTRTKRFIQCWPSEKETLFGLVRYMCILLYSLHSPSTRTGQIDSVSKKGNRLSDIGMSLGCWRFEFHAAIAVGQDDVQSQRRGSHRNGSNRPRSAGKERCRQCCHLRWWREAGHNAPRHGFHATCFVLICDNRNKRSCLDDDHDNW